MKTYKTEKLKMDVPQNKKGTHKDQVNECLLGIICLKSLSAPFLLCEALILNNKFDACM